MKKFEEFNNSINEAKEFKDSVEATEHFETIYDMIMDDRLEDWAKATSNNAVKAYKNLSRAAEEFVSSMDGY